MVSGTVPGHERVMKALNFEEPDRVPRFGPFWPEFTDVWRREKGLAPDADPTDYYGADMVVVAADETAWPTRAEVLSGDTDELMSRLSGGFGQSSQTSGGLVRTGWGAVHRFVEGTFFHEEIEPGLSERTDPDKLEFDDPLLDSRYAAAGAEAEQYKGRCAVFAKTGGPYLRAATVRGIENFLVDIAEDPEWVMAFVERMTDHMIQVGVEQIRRFGLESTGIGIYDDVATNHGLIMGLSRYEKLFYPSLRKMVAAYKKAGAAKVFTHCDGYDEPAFDLWVDAGIDATHPLESRTGMDPVKIREKYDGKLAVIGGLDNCNILPRGDRDEIKRHVLHVLEAGCGGGLVLAPHSIGTDISVDTYEYLMELCQQYGNYPLENLTARNPMGD